MTDPRQVAHSTVSLRDFSPFTAGVCDRKLVVQYFVWGRG